MRFSSPSARRAKTHRHTSGGVTASVRQIKKNNTVHNTKTVQPQSLMQQGVVRFCTVCTVFSERSALIEKIADECHLQEEDERYAEDEL